jgi:type II secretory ATPase GspE/PulE/Tfp pilus assembly ATPase PilB-like protein
MQQIEQVAWDTGSQNILKDGLNKIKLGITTPEELIRVIEKSIYE